MSQKQDQTRQDDQEKKTEKPIHSTGDAGFGVDVGEVDKTKWVND